jgi:hypothetical protein
VFASFHRSCASRAGVRRAARKVIQALASIRVRAAVTVLAFALSSWLGGRHDAATMHVRCTMHGELVDCGPPPSGTARAADPDREATMRGAPDDAVHGHEHCALSSMTRASRLVPGRPVVAATQLAVAAQTIADARIVVTRDRARYRTAPKTSPPA